MPAHPEHYQRCRLALSNRGWGRTRAWEARITGATSETRQHTATLSYPMLRDCQGFLTAWLCGTSSEIYWTPLTSPGSLNPNPEALGAVRFSACCQAHVILPLPVLFPPAQSILPKPRRSSSGWSSEQGAGTSAKRGEDEAGSQGETTKNQCGGWGEGCCQICPQPGPWGLYLSPEGG